MKTVHINWSTEDVLSIRANLTEQQAETVLDELINRHDANIGINWDFIEAITDSLYPEVAQ